MNCPGLSHRMLTFYSWESECVCLSFSIFQELICTRKKCVLSSSLIMSDCLLDLDVMFSWLGYLPWNVGSNHCGLFSMNHRGLFSGWPWSNVLLVFIWSHTLYQSFCQPDCTEHQSRTGTQCIRFSRLVFRWENWASEFTVLEPPWVSVIVILFKLEPPSWYGYQMSTVFCRICCHQLFFTYWLLYFLNVGLGWPNWACWFLLC